MGLDLGLLSLMASKLAVALLLGSAIGFERQWNQKVQSVQSEWRQKRSRGAGGHSEVPPDPVPETRTCDSRVRWRDDVIIRPTQTEEPDANESPADALRQCQVLDFKGR